MLGDVHRVHNLRTLEAVQARYLTGSTLLDHGAPCGSDHFLPVDELLSTAGRLRGLQSLQQ